MDVPNLVLYSIQQLGVMLAVGAQTIILVAYLLAVRNGVVDSQEERFARAVKRVLFIGLFLIVISGLAITALELLAAHQPVVFSPAYLLKWSLIGAAVVLARATWGNSLPKGLLEGLAGAVWYGIFAVHILAPVALWSQLLALFAVWVVVFVLVWVGLVFALRGRRSAVEAPVVQEKHIEILAPQRPAPTSIAPIPTSLAAAQQLASPVQMHTTAIPFRPAIPANLPVFTKDSPLLPLVQTKTASPAEPAPSEQPATPTVSAPSGLPQIRVMPKTLEELQTILAHL